MLDDREIGRGPAELGATQSDPGETAAARAAPELTDQAALPHPGFPRNQNHLHPGPGATHPAVVQQRDPFVPPHEWGSIDFVIHRPD